MTPKMFMCHCDLMLTLITAPPIGQTS